MAENKLEEVVEETAKKVEENPQEQLKIDDKVEKIKVKKKPSMKKFSNDPDGVTKVDLSKPSKTEKEDTVQDSKTEELDVQESSETSKEVVEEKQEQEDKKEEIVLEDVTNEEVEEVQEQVEEVIAESKATGKPIPENIQKLMNFMEETGGDLQDYVKLNTDYSKLDDSAILREYYNATKPHLNSEEIDFLLEDNFTWDEEVDDEKDIKRKKLAFKEQVASAKTHLEESKSKYYEDIKYGSKLTGEQQKAVDFFNRYNKESEENQKIVEEQTKNFLNKTNQVFNDKFKGFEYNVGEKKYRFNVKNPNDIKETQSDINNFVKKFLDKNNTMSDAKGYHKSLFTAMNPDAVARHFMSKVKQTL